MFILVNQLVCFYHLITEISILKSNFIEQSYIALAIVKGKLLSIAIHIPPVSSSITNTIELDNIPNGIRNGNDDHHGSNGVTLMTEKDVSLASLSVARCGFGCVSNNDFIFAIGMFYID